jgi:hypothetical protein
MAKEFERIVEAPILNDPFYIECIRLAEFSRSEQQRYGSLLTKDRVILGRGYNRATNHPSFTQKLERIIYQGYANHAEIEGLNDALMRGHDVQNAEIYVGSYFPKENGLLFLHNEYTCLKCPPILISYAISIINVPTPQGWLPKTTNEALVEARAYSIGEIYENRIQSVQGGWKITDLATRL